MKKKIISSMAAFLVLTLFIAPVANAAVQASEYLSSYIAYIYSEGGGDISIWFEVESTGTMDEIGALSIRLQERSTSSTEWVNVKSYSFTNYPNMLGYNDNLYISSVDYSGKVGYYYRAEVTIWAGKDGGGDSRVITTSAVSA
jgi:hypothetical protein